MIMVVAMMLVVMVWKKRALFRTMGLGWEGVGVGVVNRDTDVHIDGLMMVMIMMVVMVWKKRALLRTMGLSWKGGGG